MKEPAGELIWRDDRTRAAAAHSPWLHVTFACWVLGMLYLAHAFPGFYETLVQEDRVVEWWTAFLFGSAAVMFGVTAWRGRRLGDSGVALFCLVATGEEVSWGQRIVGFTPSAAFLENNAQQEANLHNLVEAFGQPKWTLVAVLVAYGIALPALANVPVMRRLAATVGLTIPAPPLALWFVVVAAVLVWYPVRLTGEWVEALSGALFLAAAPVRMRTTATAAALSLVGAVAAERLSARMSTDPGRLACARAEVVALVADIRADTLAPVVASSDRTHRRLYSLWRDGDLDAAAARHFGIAACSVQRDLVTRRRYGVDPWGSAYWVRAWTDATGHHVLVYSFGPNRRRDDTAGMGAAGDDIGTSDTASR